MLIKTIKEKIKKLIADGKTKEEIKVEVKSLIGSEKVENDNNEELDFDFDRDIEIKEAKKSVKMTFDTKEEIEKIVDEVEIKIAPVKSKKIYQVKETKEFKIPASAKAWGKLKTYKKDEEQLAYNHGMWFQATQGKNAKAIQYCKDAGISIKTTQIEGTDSLGGYFVPSELAAGVLELVDTYGYIRQNADVQSMSGRSKLFNKLLTDVTINFITEGADKGETNKTWEQVEVVAKKTAAIVHLSDELNDDAVINMIDNLRNNLARKQAEKEDTVCTLGTGSAGSAYGGITGWVTKIENVGDNKSIIRGTGDGAWDDLVITDFLAMMGRLPQYAKTGGTPKWYCSSDFKSRVMDRLTSAGSGNYIGSLEAGFTSLFLGKQVVETDVLKTDDVDDPSGLNTYCGYGRLDLASIFGQRQGITFATSTEGSDAFERDETLLRMVSRWGYNCHEPGTNAKAGPMILLQA